MKQFLLILIFTSISIFEISGQNPIRFYAYSAGKTINFEDKDDASYFYLDTLQRENIWQFGTPSKKIFNEAYTAPFALITDTLSNYSINNKSSFEIIVQPDDYTVIRFWHRYDTDSLKDGCIIELFKNGESGWKNIIHFSGLELQLQNFYLPTDTIKSLNNQPGFTGNSGGWVESIISGHGLYNARFRFTFSSDSLDNNREGWMIDKFGFGAIGTSIENRTFDDRINILYNTKEELFTLDIPEGLGYREMSVYDSTGKLISRGIKKEVSTERWVNGIYFLAIQTDQGIVKKKIKI